MERVVSPKKKSPEGAVHPWDFHDVAVKEQLEWISSDSCTFDFDSDVLSTWMVKGPAKLSVDGETHFCDADLLEKLIQTKQNVFEKFHPNELLKARIRANPFETIKSAFFMNRAALKMANVDAATGFMFTDIDRDVRHKKAEGPFYFADICAGPGGFTEYVLWRKSWAFKGFGLTLKGDHDFKVMESTCCSAVNFQGYYGKMDDGNICCPDNIKDFAEKIMLETGNQGVHFTMADGGFSVEGNEHLQEILSKQIYTCQCLMALEIVRKHGHFVTKLFDTFTLYTVGLLFLMYHCFEKVAIIKPNSSRPANSERYLVCGGLKHNHIIRDYLRTVVKQLWTISNSNSSADILSIVPLNVIREDERFMKYMISCNNRLGRNQTLNLLKLQIFCEDTLLIDTRQEDLRKKCLSYWRIPDRPKSVLEKPSVDDLLADASSKPEFLYVQPRVVQVEEDFSKILSDLSQWYYTPLNFASNRNTCNIYAAVGHTKVYGLYNQKWVRVKRIRLIKGTLLYGEVVVEKAVQKDSGKELEIKSLHVIDALRLGHTSLADLSYEERIPLINTYCEAINFETPLRFTRVRRKPSNRIENILQENNLLSGSLPVKGCNSEREYYQVNSVLFLKADASEFFNTTYVLRAQLILDGIENEQDGMANYKALLVYLRNTHSIK